MSRFVVRLLRALSLVLVVGLMACNSSTGPDLSGPAYLAGTWDFQGSLRGAPRAALNGQLTITQVRGREELDGTWRLGVFDNGRQESVNSGSLELSEVLPNGSVYLDFTTGFYANGRVVNARRFEGEWTLRDEDGDVYGGSFVATKR